MISNQKHKVGTDPKFTSPDEIPLLPKFLSEQNPDQASHYHLLLKEWWESVYENLNRIRDMVVNFQVADLKEESGSDLIDAKNELSQLSSELVGNLDAEINQAIQNLEGTLTKNITDHINSTNNPHSVTADQLNISTVGKTGDYGDLSNIPNKFEPSEHSHAYNTLTDIPNLFEPKTHSHAISDVTDLSTTLDDKATKVSLGNYATKVSLGNIVPGVATTSADGLMSSGDKTKLDGIPSGGGGLQFIDDGFNGPKTNNLISITAETLYLNNDARPNEVLLTINTDQGSVALNGLFLPDYLPVTKQGYMIPGNQP